MLPAGRQTILTAALAAAILVGGYLPAAEPAPPAWRTSAAGPDDTFDGRRFDYRLRPAEKQAGRYVVHEVRFPSPVASPFAENNTVPGYYYLPDDIAAGAPPRPAVVCLHILDGRGTIARLICSRLAEAGIPALWFTMAYFGERRPADWRRQLKERPDAADLMVDGLHQSAADARRAFDLLASRPAVDGEQIGIVGVSFGGIVAATAAGIDGRFNRAVLVLAGGDLMNMIGVSRETADIAKQIAALPPAKKRAIVARIETFDPVAHAPKLADLARRGRVLMFNAAEDEVIPPACTRKLAAAMGMTGKVAWQEGFGHYTMIGALSDILDASTDFFAADLPAAYRAARAAPPAAVRTPLGGLLFDLSRLLAAAPADDNCFFADLSFDATVGDEHITGSLRLIRDAGNRFRLTVKTNTAYSLDAGRGDYPWLLAGTAGVLFRGDRNVAAAPPLADGIAPATAAYVRGAAGICSLAAAFPGILGQWVTLETADGGTVVTVRMKERKERGRMVVRFDAQTRKPRSVTVEAKDVRATVTFRHWEMDAVATGGMFAPPEGNRAVRVRCADLNRMFAALLNALAARAR